jgi:peptidoglycan/LPS O-acetylase OafA/YrhL
MQRIPSLDGLRAVAISLVCLSHLSYVKNQIALHTSSFGPLGVRIFFVISGMLITKLLVEERQRSGEISLRAFYIRRTVRIFPAMWFYVAVMATLSIAGLITLQRHDILHSLTYTMNYFPVRSWYLGHLWSLSVEEQFYLLWPLVLCFGTPRVAIRVALLAIGLAPLLRFLILLLAPTTLYHEWFPASCDSIATGCLLSLLPVGRWKNLTIRIAASRWFVTIPILVFLANSLRHRAEGYVLLSMKDRVLFMGLDTIGVLIMNCGIALVVQRVVTYPHDLVGQILNARPTVWLGRISYSLYLWQMPFLNHEASSWITRTPFNLAAALCAAWFSYYLIENPLLQLRKHLRWGEPKRAVQVDPKNTAVVTEAVG